MLIRGRVHENRDLISLPVESLMPGRVADIKTVPKKE